MFKKIAESIASAFLGKELFDLGVIAKDEEKKNSYTEISMSLNSAKGKQFINLGIKQKNGGRTNYSWSRIHNVESLRTLRDACDKMEILLASDFSDEEIVALESQFLEEKKDITSRFWSTPNGAPELDDLQSKK